MDEVRLYTKRGCLRREIKRQILFLDEKGKIRLLRKGFYLRMRRGETISDIVLAVKNRIARFRSWGDYFASFRPVSAENGDFVFVEILKE